jgi:hypothetical protein
MILNYYNLTSGDRLVLDTPKISPQILQAAQKAFIKDVHRVEGKKEVINIIAGINFASFTIYDSKTQQVVLEINLAWDRPQLNRIWERIKLYSTVSEVPRNAPAILVMGKESDQRTYFNYIHSLSTAIFKTAEMESKKPCYYPTNRFTKGLGEDLYKKLQRERPYKFPHRYLCYETFCELMVSSNVAIEQGTPQANVDEVAFKYYEITSKWIDFNFPIYGVDKNTLAEFAMNQIQERSELHQLSDEEEDRNYCILIPKGILKTSSGDYIEKLWVEILVNHQSIKKEIVQERGHVTYSTHLTPYSKRVTVTAIDTKEIFWFKSKDYGKDAVTLKEIGNIKQSDCDRELLSTLLNIALNTILIIEVEKGFQLESVPLEISPSKKCTRPRREQHYWKIRSLDLKPTAPKKSMRRSTVTDRRSPHPHWRLWHWRQVPVGAGRMQRKKVRIGTSYVNPN